MFTVGKFVNYVGIGTGEIVKIRDDGRGRPLYDIEIGNTIFVARAEELSLTFDPICDSITL